MILSKKAEAHFRGSVSEDLLLKISQNPDFLTEPVMHEMTVLLFSLPGMLAATAKMDPVELVKAAADSIEAVKREVIEHDGVVHAFMGNYFEAYFGAPLEDPLHAEKALQAALKLQARRFAPFGAPALTLCSGPLTYGPGPKPKNQLSAAGLPLKSAHGIAPQVPEGKIYLNEAAAQHAKSAGLKISRTLELKIEGLGHPVKAFELSA